MSLTNIAREYRSAHNTIEMRLSSLAILPTGKTDERMRVYVANATRSRTASAHRFYVPPHEVREQGKIVFCELVSKKEEFFLVKKRREKKNGKIPLSRSQMAFFLDENPIVMIRGKNEERGFGGIGAIPPKCFTPPMAVLSANRVFRAEP